MPFDEFTIEQLAGDLLPIPRTDQLIGDRLYPLPRVHQRGGLDPRRSTCATPGSRETTSEVWLGLTAGCAVCHDHKFDPLKRKEFYSLFAFFNSTTENALDGNGRPTSR